MTFRRIKVAFLLFVGLSALSTQANNVSFESTELTPNSEGQVSITVTYDYTDFAMFGGTMNLQYDLNLFSLVSYTQAPLAADAQAAASPVGTHVPEEGLYQEFGIGSFDFLNGGMTSAGVVGTFVFDVLDGSSASGPSDCPNAYMCLTPVSFGFPFFTINGEPVNDEIFANGITEIPRPVPIPGAAWFLLSGIGVLTSLRRKSP